MVNPNSPVELLHWRTSLGFVDDRGVESWRLDLANQPSSIKSYPGAHTISLPREIRASSIPAGDVLSGTVPKDSRLDDDVLSTVLFLGAGVTRRLRSPQGAPVLFRTAMSAGNLHPIEVYVVRDGVWNYDPLSHRLVLVRAAPPAAMTPDGALIVLTGIPFRTCWKYAERGYRHLYWDAGTLLANLLAAAEAHGLDPRVEVGFADREVAELVGIDGVDEMPLALVRLGADVELPTPAVLSAPARSRAAAGDVKRLGSVVQAQEASSLSLDEVEGWRLRTAALGRSAEATVAAPGPLFGGDRIEEVILRRGSVRRFVPTRCDAELLSWALAAAARRVPWDASPHATLIEHFVNVHDIDGVPTGTYRFDGLAGLGGSLGDAEDLRATSASLCLDQASGGASAYTVFHTCDLDEILAGSGDRGYRAVQLEAGIVAGRLALNAVGLGYGATGLTFSDARVVEFLGATHQPLLATAIGAPEHGPSPSGAPGQPRELRRLAS
jgi:SagB-type dehydrogenase family enzyme